MVGAGRACISLLCKPVSTRVTQILCVWQVACLAFVGPSLLVFHADAAASLITSAAACLNLVFGVCMVGTCCVAGTTISWRVNGV